MGIHIWIRPKGGLLERSQGIVAPVKPTKPYATVLLLHAAP